MDTTFPLVRPKWTPVLTARLVATSRMASSLEAEASALSSVASSQDSLHNKQPKKKGIKSSIGRLFGKKEKGRLGHMAHRHVMVDPHGGASAALIS